MNVIHRPKNSKTTYIPSPVYNASKYVTGHKPAGYLHEPLDDMYHFSGEKKRVIKRKEDPHKGTSLYELREYHRLIEEIRYVKPQSLPSLFLSSFI